MSSPNTAPNASKDSMSAVRRFFLSRKTALTLLCLALFAITLAALIPQPFVTPAAELETWRAAHPLVNRLAVFLGLYSIYTHPAFALILAGVMISLSFSTVDQFNIARRRTFGLGDDGKRLGGMQSPVNAEQAAAVFRALGYLQVGRGTAVRTLIRQPWGYWGNFLFHLGLVITIASSLLIALTQQRALLDLAVGELHQPTMAWSRRGAGTWQ